jgi:hypothetical protein
LQQPKVLYVDDVNQVGIFLKLWPDLIIKQDHLHAMMRVSRVLPANHSQANAFQDELSQCITRPSRSDHSDNQAFIAAAAALKRGAEECSGLEPGFRAAFQKENGR